MDLVVNVLNYHHINVRTIHCLNCIIWASIFPFEAAVNESKYFYLVCQMLPYNNYEKVVCDISYYIIINNIYYINIRKIDL